jgi:UDP-glucuronate 4-epimerase
MQVLVTGTAGFIGFHLARRLLECGEQVVGLDSVNDYYDVSLKEKRLELLSAYPAFCFERQDVASRAAVETVFARYRPQRVVHLAAQAGVRHSLTHPHVYGESNLLGFLNILEGVRTHGCEHLVFASSSSVYGASTAMPFSVHGGVDHPLSLYAATKRANELMAHSYSHLYNLPVTGLRFFSVFGPWGRPDMALFKFVHAILHDEPIDVYNGGAMRRDFTYIDDIVEGTLRVLAKPAQPNPAFDSAHADPATSSAPFRLLNVGSHRPVELGDFIALIERLLGKQARKRMLPMQSGDITESLAETHDLLEYVGFLPSTPLEVGVERAIAWYRDFYKL